MITVYYLVLNLQFTSVSFNSFLIWLILAEGSIYVFDLRVNKARIIHRWFDQASTNGLSISSSPNSQWIACG